MNIINNINLKKLGVIIFIVSILLPVEVATPINDIDVAKNYVICKISTATNIDYDILYDSQGRDISSLKVENRLINVLTRAKTPYLDPYYNLNTYIIYTNSDIIEGDTLTLRGLYRARILYPIKRESCNNIVSEWCLFWFEIL